MSHPFRVLHINLNTGKGHVKEFGDQALYLGGSGLAAALYDEYGHPEAPADDPRQPLIFAIGPLTGYFPLMSKVVCGFKSPQTGHYAESHAGGRLALSMRFSNVHAIMITGRAPTLSCVVAGSRELTVHDVHYLRGHDVFATGKYMRKMGKDWSGHRSTIRIGPAGENGVAFSCINVDSYRHFGRLGSGAVMGYKNLKALTVLGDASLPIPDGKQYPALLKDIFAKLTHTDMMRKYHDLGTAENLLALNELKALPWRNLQQTTDPDINGISGERFAEQLLLRQTACSGCPVGCIHIGLLRQQFAGDHEYLYRQVSYDYEPIFAQGSMLGLTVAGDVLALMDETEKLGMDVMSSGVALAWATEAFEKGLITEEETLTPLAFGNLEGYMTALNHLGARTNEFYQTLGMGTESAAQKYNGQDFACVLGQEMAGYATGEVYFVSQALGFRHAHLDSGGYSYDQKHTEKDVDHAVKFMIEDEQKRVMLCSMVSCLFARGVYSPEFLQEALTILGKPDVAQNLESAATAMQAKRWELKFKTGYRHEDIRIPKRFTEVVTWKGGIDIEFLNNLKQSYGDAITALVK